MFEQGKAKRSDSFHGSTGPVAPIILECHDRGHIEQVAEMVADGEVVIFPICGVMGFVFDGTNAQAIERVFELKGRPRSQTLITAGSQRTIRRLVDLKQLASTWTITDVTAIYDLPVVLILPAGSIPSDFTSPAPDVPAMPTVAVWWANYYPPIANLEQSLQRLRPRAFLGGTSCNISGKPSITSGQDAFAHFGRDHLIPAIVKDPDFEQGRGLLTGSHTMLRIQGEDVVAHRAGSIHADSFQPMLKGHFIIPEHFRNVPGAAILDVAIIRRNRHYLRQPVA